ncbi:MAG: aminotransferase class V-fold PLP-dependent enzyme [Chloroflexi bacterium]|nr:aminotransferase class V-fold PLP-dependent enzyme [Chloroflexota bacterium]
MSTTMQELRAREFARLDESGHVYLDYTGGGLYGTSQIQAHADLLTREVLGNPHSRNPTSLASTHNVEAARERIRRFFKADPDEYEVIFTLNASGALKLVGESYPFQPGSRYVLTADNHNSVNGIRECARARGATVEYLPLNKELRVENFEALLPEADPALPSLFAYPAQSNFSGVKHPLEWVEQARARGYDVLLDAAAFVPTSRLDLSAVRPDFVTISFYKMFGFPTGVGALLMRREAMARLHRPWFAGGTVRFVSAQNQEHLFALSGEAFEDGTVNYLSIAAVPLGLDFLDRGGMERINRHVAVLTEQLLAGLHGLRHSGGQPLVRVYGPQAATGRGGTVAFNLVDPDGQVIDYRLVEERAIEANISFRTGCFCNPGAAEFAFEYAAVEAYKCFTSLRPEEFTLQQFSSCMHNQPVGAIRVSLGIASSETDIHRLLDLLRTFADCHALPRSPRDIPDIVGG